METTGQKLTKYRLGDIATIEVSTVDKKSVEGERSEVPPQSWTLN